MTKIWLLKYWLTKSHSTINYSIKTWSFYWKLFYTLFDTNACSIEELENNLKKSLLLHVKNLMRYAIRIGIVFLSNYHPWKPKQDAYILKNDPALIVEEYIAYRFLRHCYL
jgi:hypothetical protein